MADVLVAHSSRSFDRWLPSHWRFFAALSASSSAGGTWCTSASLPGAIDRADDVPALWQVQRSSRLLRVTLPQIQVDLSGFLSWSRGPRARAAGGSLHTDAILKALSAGCVSGSALYSSDLCRPVAAPKLLLQGGSSSFESSALLKLEVVEKIPKTQNTTISNRCPLSSRNHRLIIHSCNGRSLSGMGLTRERLCCARGWLSRLDMYTCQTSIKTDIFL